MILVTKQGWPMVTKDGRDIPTSADHLDALKKSLPDVTQTISDFMEMTGYSLGVTMSLPMMYILRVVQQRSTREDALDREMTWLQGG